MSNVPGTFRRSRGPIGADGFVMGGLKQYTKRLSIGANLTGSEQDLWSYDLPATALVTGFVLHVVTAESTGSTKTIDVGLLSSESGGDADGFIDGLSVASTGLYVPGPVITDGATEEYVSATTRGVLMVHQPFAAGANTAGDVGTYFEKPHATSSVTAKSVSITSGSAFSEFRGTLYINMLIVV